MKFKIIYFNHITPLEKSLENRNEKIIMILLSVGKAEFNIEKSLKLQITTFKALFKCAGYSLTPINEISLQKENKEVYNYQGNHQSKSLSNNTKGSQDIQLELEKFKENHPYEASKDKIESNVNQIIESFRHFQAEIFDSQSLKYLEKIEEIESSQQNKFTKVLMKKMYTLKEINEKKSNSNSQNIQQLIDEFDIMITLHHPNILKVHGKFINNENQQNPSILLEYCPFNLDQKIKSQNLSKVQQVFWIYQIAEGMKYIHSRKIIHHNLKSSNILISEGGIIKISDFEKAQMNKANSKTAEMEDVYAFGSIIYFILSGGKNIENTNEIVTTNLPLLAKQLIYACCSVQPECRPTFETICDVLKNNDFNLISLSQQEIQEVHKLIKQHKSLITNDSE